jgi:hypothetical protein
MMILLNFNYLRAGDKENSVTGDYRNGRRRPIFFFYYLFFLIDVINSKYLPYNG